MRRSGITRRGLLSSGAVAALGATKAGSAMAATSSAAAPAERVETAVVSTVEDGAILELRKRDGTEERLQDPKPREAWAAGDEAMIVWQFLEGEWKLADIQRMYRPIEDLTVEGREGGSVIDTSGPELQLNEETEARGAPNFDAAPLASIEPGEVVSGIGHRVPNGNSLAVDQIGVLKE